MAEPLRYRRPHSDALDDARVRTRQVTPGLVDELGERQFTVDSSSDTLLETLRFRREFGDSPQFEAALRASVDATRPLRHASLATVASVERDDTGLCLISKVPSGRRLSELPPADNDWTFAMKAVRELAPALVVLHENGGAAHGTLSPRSVVVTRDGRLVMVEHVLASAIASLNMTRAELRAIGIVVADGPEPVQFTEQTDLVQLGFLALSLLVGRQLPATDFPGRAPALLDEFVRGVGSPKAAQRIRAWLERAMQIGGAQPFASSFDAEAAFDEVSHDVSVRVAESAGALLAFASEVRTGDDASPDVVPDAKPSAKIDKHPRAVPKPAAKTADARPVSIVAPAKAAPAKTLAATDQARSTRTGGPVTWMMAGLAVLAIGEGVVLTTMLYTRPAATAQNQEAGAVADAAIAPSLPAAPTPSAIPSATPAPPPTRPAPKPVATPAVTRAARPAVTPAAKPTVTPAAKPPATRVAPTAPAVPAFGGLTVTSPIDLQVFKDGVLLGSTAAPIAVNDGRYSLEFVNAALGFHVTLPATVSGGRMTTLKVPVPNGRVSINAVPWAEITIDDRIVGQTPLANLSLPIGSHEVVFSHPQLGEKRQTVVVKVDGIVRVTQNYR